MATATSEMVSVRVPSEDDFDGAEQYTAEQLRRLLYHEARHIGWAEPNDINEDGEGKAIIVGHDLELFAGEVSDTGAWESFRRRVGAEFRQPKLFAEE